MTSTAQVERRCSRLVKGRRMQRIFAMSGIEYGEAP